MVIAVIAVRMMQMPIDEIIDVSVMRHGQMPAVWSMSMVFVVIVTIVSEVAPQRHFLIGDDVHVVIHYVHIVIH